MDKKLKLGLNAAAKRVSAIGKDIQALDARVDREYVVLEKAAKDLSRANRNLRDAQMRLEARPKKAALIAKEEKAQTIFSDALSVYEAAEGRIADMVEQMNRYFDSLHTLVGEDSEELATMEDRFNTKIGTAKARVESMVADVTFPAKEEPAEPQEQQIPVPQEKAEENTDKSYDVEQLLRRLGAYPAYAPMPMYIPTQAQAPAAPARPDVRVAPINIDISRVVEKAVAGAMEKFSAELDRRLADLKINLPEITAVAAPAVAPAPITVPAVTLTQAYDMETKISDDEKFLLEKLTGLMNNLHTMSDTMMALTQGFAEISQKQAEISEQQKKTNDIQRFTQREQLGVQTSQKVLGKDQIAIVEEQNNVAEAQKNAIELQAQVSEVQKAVAEEQKGIMEAQSAIEESVKAAQQTQADIAAVQEQLVRKNAQYLDAQNDLVAIQDELIAGQKEAAAAQKAVAREQKATTDRQKGVVDAQRGLLEDMKAIAKENKSLSDSVEREIAKLEKKGFKRPVRQTVAQEDASAEKVEEVSEAEEVAAPAAQAEAEPNQEAAPAVTE